MFGTNPPRVYQYQGMGAADKGALSGIQNLPGVVAATGYDPTRTVQQGQAVAGSVSGVPQYSAMALQSGFDPGNKYYEDMYRQFQQNNMANLAAQGVANTPYGAGIMADASSTFQQDWFDRMLQRQAMGMNTASQGYGTYGTGVAGGANLEQAGAMLPFNVAQTQIADYLNYLSGGTAARGLDLERWKMQQGARNAMFGNIGKTLGSVFGMF